MPSMHVGVPLPHSSAPSLQLFGLPVHAAPCRQSMHMPDALQTLSVPHDEPAIRCIVVLVQTGVAPLAFASYAAFILACVLALVSLFLHGV